MPPRLVPSWIEALPWAELAMVFVAFCCGAALGSFLNVIAYRVPRGESPVAGGSRCPACGSDIRWRDNVPVLGWLMLGGRCRSCGGAISARYVVVELCCGLLLATVAAAELACDPRGLDRLLIHGDVRPLLVFSGQAALLLTLTAWSLLADRGYRVTVATRWLTVALAIAACVAGGLLGAEVAADGAGISSRWPALVLSSLAGGGLGWIVGRIAGAGPDRDMLAVAGCALGWQGAAVVAILTMTIRVAAPGTAAARHAGVAATLVPIIVCGRWLDPLAAATRWFR